MNEIFERIFWEVGKRYGMTDWWEIFDSEVFEEVCEGIAFEMGWTLDEGDEDYFDVCDRNSTKFCEWAGEMAEDL